PEHAQRGLGGVTGIAIWTDMATRAPKTNSFSIYVSGLSNGLVKEQTRGPNGKDITSIKRKTLKLDFIRPTDEINPKPNDIQRDTGAGPAEPWIYRPTPEVPAGPMGGGATPPKKPFE